AREGARGTSGRWPAHTSGTLVGGNGPLAAWLLAVPVVLTIPAGIGLHLRCSRGSSAGTAAGWVAVAMLGAFTFLGAASIGVLVLPVTLLLGAAAALTPSG